ncbi:hypothetical protein MTR_6g014365 [Medicago truncatula]|uniref:SCR-like protein n=1 Tax=Medicago truncatula TaxID=3880 RepID=A0A072U5U7_MEDTR|nr:hypothetical protein MTR_6g014365 [Medicago truncatula]
MPELFGTCLDGGIDCYDHFKSQYPNSVPRHCICNTTSKKTHTCTCCIICGSKPDNIDFLVNQDDIDYIPPQQC